MQHDDNPLPTSHGAKKGSLFAGRDIWPQRLTLSKQKNVLMKYWPTAKTCLPQEQEQEQEPEPTPTLEKMQLAATAISNKVLEPVKEYVSALPHLAACVGLIEHMQQEFKPVINESKQINTDDTSTRLKKLEVASERFRSGQFENRFSEDTTRTQVVKNLCGHCRNNTIKDLRQRIDDKVGETTAAEYKSIEDLGEQVSSLNSANRLLWSQVKETSDLKLSHDITAELGKLETAWSAWGIELNNCKTNLSPLLNRLWSFEVRMVHSAANAFLIHRKIVEVYGADSEKKIAREYKKALEEGLYRHGHRGFAGLRRPDLDHLRGHNIDRLSDRGTKRSSKSRDDRKDAAVSAIEKETKRETKRTAKLVAKQKADKRAT